MHSATDTTDAPIAGTEDLENAINTADGSTETKSAKHEGRAQTRRYQAIRRTMLSEEYRHATLEMRAQQADDQVLVITGRPIVYGSPYSVAELGCRFQETVERGAATKVLGDDIRFLFNHKGMPLARTTAGNLTLEDRADGLYFEARLDPRSHAATDLYYAIERGDVSQMSVGFVVDPDQDEWNVDGDGAITRSIRGFKSLLDVSAVTYPCSPSTSIEVAKRMALRMPVESLAKTGDILAELRAGKTMSATNQTILVDMLTNMHQLASNVGIDVSDMMPDELEADQDEATVDEETGVSDAGGEPIGDVDDGSSRALELDQELRALKAKRNALLAKLAA